MTEPKDAPPPPQPAPARPAAPPVPPANPSLIQTLTEGDRGTPRNDAGRPVAVPAENPAFRNLMTKGRSGPDGDKLKK